MIPSRAQLQTLLAKCVPMPHMQPDQWGVSKQNVLLACVNAEDLWSVPEGVYEGLDHASDYHIFMKSRLEKYLGMSRDEAREKEIKGVIQI